MESIVIGAPLTSASIPLIVSVLCQKKALCSSLSVISVGEAGFTILVRFAPLSLVYCHRESQLE
jgi:hypothetical protein